MPENMRPWRDASLQTASPRTLRGRPPHTPSQARPFSPWVPSPAEPQELGAGPEFSEQWA